MTFVTRIQMGRELQLKNSIFIEERQIFDLSIESLWPIVSDTNRLNRSIGLFPVTFSPFVSRAQRLVRKAKGKAFGLLHIEWIENVFEWIKESHYSVERNYTKGPVKRVIWKVSLDKITEYKTEVTLTGRFEYKSLLGKIALKQGVIPQLLKTFTYITEASQIAQQEIPSRKERPLVDVDTDVLMDASEHLKELVLNPLLVDALVLTLKTATDEEVTSMQPYRWADVHEVSKKDAVELFLFASEVGVLDYEWSLMCPNCRVAKDHANSLKDVKESVHCDLCGVDFELDFDRYVEMTFQVNGSIRKVSKDIYCINGPVNSPHTVGQFRVPSHSSITVPWKPSHEDLQIRVLKHNFKIPFSYGNNQSNCEMNITTEGIKQSSLQQSDQLTMTNESDEEYILVIENTKWDEFALTARDVTSLQLFRDLLPAEVLAPGTQIGVGKLTILFTDLKDSTQLYERVGDASAYSDVQKHFNSLGAVIQKNEGTIVKTIGDSIMAAFSIHQNALRAAKEIQQSVRQLNEELLNPVTIKIGFHEGPVIAVNANGVLDYFGRTVNMAARVQQQSIGNDIVLEKNLYLDMDMSNSECAITEFTTQLHGMGDRVELIRLTPEQVIKKN